jgi:type VI protein secretion system component Hcp
VAVNAYLLITLADGSFLKSENSQQLGSGFQDPFPGRPALGPGKILFPLQSYSVGVSTAVTIGTKGGVGAGKPDFGDLAVMRFFDVATTTFFIDLCSGKALKFVDLLISSTINADESTFAGFGLGKVLLSGLQWSGSEETPEESVSFAYGQIWTGYRVQNTQTDAFGPWAIRSWDRTKNAPI